eukprot:CAMPEP_0168769416 /NCGR_PEP_ID=MMETSP0725-20121227/2391_1 /TAXON_ID=265536 /ORGANISM="Amphiprora sp., Strain CCMP467" /LENGTH=120 /DNA_ID=CAMNT_0008818825 /DNA_START=366 /DNA_END=726 /DNA_ORIENTATION=+
MSNDGCDRSCRWSRSQEASSGGGCSFLALVIVAGEDKDKVIRLLARRLAKGREFVLMNDVYMIFEESADRRLEVCLALTGTILVEGFMVNEHNGINDGMMVKWCRAKCFFFQALSEIMRR